MSFPIPLRSFAPLDEDGVGKEVEADVLTDDAKGAKACPFPGGWGSGSRAQS